MVRALRQCFDDHPYAEWLIPTILAMAMLGQVWLAVTRMSQHADEAIHLYAGYRLLKCGDYSFGREHPPLVKIVAAAPLLWRGVPIDCAGPPPGALIDEGGEATTWLYEQPDWWPVLLRARSSMAAVLVGLAFAIWFVSRRLFGRAAATLATLLFAFEPSFIAHGGLILNNILLSFLFLSVVYAFYVWTESRQGFVLAGAGILLGLTLLTKHNAAFLVFLLAGLALAEPWVYNQTENEKRWRALRNLGAIAAMAVIAALTIWGFYGMRYSQAGRRTLPLAAPTIQNTSSFEVCVLQGMRSAHVLPQAYLDGVLDAVSMVHDSAAGAAVFNRHYDKAPWFTFPVTLLIKLTLGCLGFFSVGFFSLWRADERSRKALLFLVVPALLYLAAAIAVPRFGGIWHLFPSLPLLFVAASAGAVLFIRSHRWGAALIGTLLTLHIASCLHAYPDYFSYANEAWGGPANLYRLLPMTDAGQTFWEVKQYMQRHPGTPCWLDVDWQVPASSYEIPCTQMGNFWTAPLPARMKGIVFVSASWWQIDDNPGDPLDPFRDLKPNALLAGSAMLVYEGEFDTRLLAARALENNSNVRFAQHDLESALALTRQAAEMAPESDRAHHYYCVMLAQTGYLRQSYDECTLALRLSAAYPVHHQEADILRQRIAKLGQRLNLSATTQVNGMR